jgi:DNA-binding transcriptional ArsR family regulator
MLNTVIASRMSLFLLFCLTCIYVTTIVNHMVNNSTERLDVLFHALADATRRGMLARLADGVMSVKELAEPFDMSAPAITKHLKVLEKAGLLRREIEGRVHRCYLVPEAMDDAAGWIAYYQQFWNNKLDSLDQYLKNKETRQGETDE